MTVSTESGDSAPTNAARSQPTTPDQITGRDRLRSAMLPRLSRRQLVAGIMCALLGFAAVIQVRSRDSDSVLDSARQSDLVQILDAQSQLADRLEDELAGLQGAYDDLHTNGDQQQTALEQARERESTLGILAGSVPASGPGVVVSINDPYGDAPAIRVLGALDELRNAGAEVLQIDDVRVVASTHVLDGPSGPEVDGTPLTSPYQIRAIGDPDTLATAMAIPGGVIDTFATDGLTVTVSVPDEVVVDALRPPTVPEYSRPADG
jgi:uncharacterized protein YlxW (UPF0749 family)